MSDDMIPGAAAIVGGVTGTLIVVWVIVGSFIAPHERNHRLDDGRTVHCLVQESPFGNSLSCDWANAKVKP